MIYFKCPDCHSKYEMDDSVAGRKLECARCPLKFIVPIPESLAATAIRDDAPELKTGILLVRNTTTAPPPSAAAPPAPASEPSAPRPKPPTGKKVLKPAKGRARRRRQLPVRAGTNFSGPVILVMIIVLAFLSFFALRQRLGPQPQTSAAPARTTMPPAPPRPPPNPPAITQPPRPQMPPTVATTPRSGSPDLDAHKQRANQLRQTLMAADEPWTVPLTSTSALHPYSPTIVPLLLGNGPDGPDIQALAGESADGTRILAFSTTDALRKALAAQNAQSWLPRLSRWLSHRHSSPTLAVKDLSELAAFGKIVLPFPNAAIVGNNLPICTLDCDAEDFAAILSKRSGTGAAGMVVIADQLAAHPAGRQLLDQLAIAASPSTANLLATATTNASRHHPCWALQAALDFTRDRSALDADARRQTARALLLGIRHAPSLEHDFMKRVAQTLADVPAPRGGQVPLTPWQQAALAYESRRAALTPDAPVAASRFADLFPGRATTAPTTATIKIDTSRPYWHPIGLYANPGQAVTITLPAAAAQLGMRVRIGQQLHQPGPDDHWYRAPSISTARPLAHTETTLATPYGGLVIIEVPAVLGGRRHYRPPLAAMQTSPPVGQTVELQVTGAVPVPVYDATAAASTDFRPDLAENDTPFVEIRGREIIFLLPRDLARNVPDPAALLQHWEGVLATCRELVGRERADRAPFPLIVTFDLVDDQPALSYPVHWPVFSANKILDLNMARSAGAGGLLAVLSGFYAHKIGKVIDDPQGAGILLAMAYVDQHAGGNPRSVHPKLSAAYDSRYVQRIFTRRGQLSGGDVFERIQPFCMFADHFGIKPLMDALAATAADTANDPARLKHAFIGRLSLATKRNLYPFFRCWGYRTTGRSHAGIRAMDVWMPPGFPDNYVVIK